MRWVVCVLIAVLLALSPSAAEAASCPCSIFGTDGAPPAFDAFNDGQPIELGVRFRADVPGDITALRFYKSPRDTAAHVVHLWTNDGTLLAEAVAQSESAAGWQVVALPEPVEIEAGTTYVSSYHSPDGWYAADVPYFTTTYDQPPLHALATGLDGGNGIYRYGPSGFPTLTFNAANYWVDVVFEPHDTTPPEPPSRPDLMSADDSGFSDADNVTNDATPRFSGTAEDGAVVRLLADGVVVGTGTAAGGVYVIESSALGDGPHLITADAADERGNRSGASAALPVVIDSLAPRTIIVGADVLPHAARLEFSSPDAAHRFECSLDGGPFQSCASGIRYDGLAGGDHRFAVRATDLAGNLGAEASRVVHINSDPVAGTVRFQPGAPTTEDTVAAIADGFTDADGDALTYRYRWSVNGAPVGADASELALAPPGHGDRGDVIAVEVTATDGHGASAAASASVRVVNAAPRLALPAAAAVGTYSDPITPFQIGATDPDGDAVSLATGTPELPQGLTLVDGGGGVATVSGRVTAPAGAYSPQIVASDGVARTTGVARVTIQPERATVATTPGQFVPATAATAPVTLSATVTDEPDGSPADRTRATVDFLVYKSTNLTGSPDAACSGVTATASGAATCTLSLAPDNWTVLVRIGAGNRFFAPALGDPVVVTVYQPSTDTHASGGGWIADGAGRANLGFTVRYKSGTTPQGQSVFVFRDGGYTQVVKSNSWTGGGLAFGADKVAFSGKANVTVFDAAGEPVAGLGGGNMTYRVDAVDGAPDRYAISIYRSDGRLYRQLGTTASPIALSGGNITVRSR